MKPRGWEALREYQKHAALELAEGRKVGLWVAAGLGKTATVLAALKLKEVRPPWLFVTRAIGRHAFARDAAWVLGPDDVPGVLWGGKNYNHLGVHEDGSYSSLSYLLTEHHSCVTNYDILEQRMQDLLSVPWNALILDEAHNVKGGYQRPKKRRDGSIVRTRYHWTKELTAHVRRRNGVVWQMTATPIRDRRRDLWSQLDLALGGPVLPGPQHHERWIGWKHLKRINQRRQQRGLPNLTMNLLYETLDKHVCFPGPFGVPLIYPEIELDPAAATCFLRRYCFAHQGQYGLDTLGDTAPDELTQELEQRLTHHYIKLTRAEVASELPAVQQITEVVDPEKRRIPRQYRGGGIEEAIARAGWQKFDTTIEMVEDHVTEGGRVVVAVTRKRLARELTIKLQKAAEKFAPAVRRELTVETVTGDVEIRRRVELLRQFNEGKGPGVLVATMDCMSESVDLHYVPVVIVVTPPYTPGQVDQFRGRFARLGGVPCTIYYLIADGTIDVAIKEKLGAKLHDVVQVGADTAAMDETQKALEALYDEEKIISELREALKALPDFEEE